MYSNEAEKGYSIHKEKMNKIHNKEKLMKDINKNVNKFKYERFRINHILIAINNIIGLIKYK